MIFPVTKFTFFIITLVVLQKDCQGTNLRNGRDLRDVNEEEIVEERLLPKSEEDYFEKEPERPNICSFCHSYPPSELCYIAVDRDFVKYGKPENVEDACEEVEEAREITSDFTESCYEAVLSNYGCSHDRDEGSEDEDTGSYDEFTFNYDEFTFFDEGEGNQTQQPVFFDEDEGQEWQNTWDKTPQPTTVQQREQLPQPLPLIVGSNINDCPDGFEPTSDTECEIYALHHSQVYKSVNVPTTPKGCYTKSHNNVYFNLHPDGKADKERALVCKLSLVFSQYRITGFNRNDCADGFELISATECQGYADYHDKKFESVSVDTYPRGCYTKIKDYVYFNRNQTGNANNERALVCKPNSPPTLQPSVLTSPNKPNSPPTLQPSILKSSNPGGSGGENGSVVAHSDAIEINISNSTIHIDNVYFSHLNSQALKGIITNTGEGEGAQDD